MKEKILKILSPRYRRKHLILFRFDNRISAWFKAQEKGMGQVNHPTIKYVTDELFEVRNELNNTL